MSAANVSQQRTLNVAVIGKPNAGKSTLFTALSGIRVQTGNYPGVTVERKIGRVHYNGHEIRLIDVPGTYSLTPRSADEKITIDLLQHGDPHLGPVDVILCVVDATQLERGLFLIGQLLEIGKPILVALNMFDIAEQRGIGIDTRLLSESLGGIPVIPTVAHKQRGVGELLTALTTLGDVVQDSGNPETPPRIPQDAAGRYAWAEQLAGATLTQNRLPSHWTDRVDRLMTGRVSGFIAFLVIMFVVFQSIFTWVGPVMDVFDAAQGAATELVTANMAPGPLRSLIVDGVIAGVGGVLIFVPQIALLFLLIGLLEDSGYMARAALVTDRLMSKFGLSGKSFLPLMSSFACAVPGIMATRVIENRRDRFITILVAPLMSCSARLPVYLLMIGTFVPDQKLLGGIVSVRGLVLLAMLLFGAVVAIPVAWLLGKTYFKGQPSGFLLELPDYKFPSLRTVLWKSYDGTKEFVTRAGTLIFATAVVIWAAGYFPGDHTQQHALETELETITAAVAGRVEDGEALLQGLYSGSSPPTTAEIQEVKERIAELQAANKAAEPQVAALTDEMNSVNHELIEGSFLGRTGKFIEPIVRPCGWDWRIGTAIIASFPAREVVIATMGTIFSLGAEVDENHAGLRSVLAEATWPDGRPLFTLPVALSVMVFIALCAQCVSTLAIIRRETGSWRWPVFCFVYMTLLAYIGAIIAYEAATALGW